VNVKNPEKTCKRVTIVGLGRSGIGAARLLADQGLQVTVTDCRKAEDIKNELDLLPDGISFVAGGHPASVFEGVDMVVVSPGVPLHIDPLKICRTKGIAVIGELELAYRSTDLPFMAITGTNGKSTVTSLAGEMLNASGISAFVGGNIGNSLCEGLTEIKQEEKHGSQSTKWIVAEVSSFQLETTELFSPRLAAVLNISPDHLDRYSSMDEYISAKTNIFKQQNKHDYLVLNADDPAVVSLAGLAPGEVVWFSSNSKVEAEGKKGVFLRDDELCFHLDSRQGKIIHQESIRIKGSHNLENAMAAACLALLAGVAPGVVAGVLRDFPGLEHRVEFVGSLGGVTYINDSKATNIGATEKSLQSFSEPVILIAGGFDKKTDFSLLLPEVSKRVKTLILIGETAEKLAAVLGSASPVIFADDMDDAVQKADLAAVKGDIVLLSPACASFDMFADFEDRGRKFKEAVRRLPQKKKMFIKAREVAI